MRRLPVPFAVAAGMAFSACSIGGASLSSGFNQSPVLKSSASNSVSTSDRGSLGATPGSTKLASAADIAPSSAYEKAPKGALADRDYSGAVLDADKARDLINGYRAQHKLKPLKLNAQLTAAAKAHSQDLAKWDRISHYGSDGSNPWDRVKRAGYNAKVAAENVGTGQASIAEVMKGWEESEAHNKNLLLTDIDSMGIALVTDSKTEFKSFWTLVLAASN